MPLDNSGDPTITGIIDDGEGNSVIINTDSDAYIVPTRLGGLQLDWVPLTEADT